MSNKKNKNKPEVEEDILTPKEGEQEQPATEKENLRPRVPGEPARFESEPLP